MTPATLTATLDEIRNLEASLPDVSALERAKTDAQANLTTAVRALSDLEARRAMNNEKLFPVSEKDLLKAREAVRAKREALDAAEAAVDAGKHAHTLYTANRGRLEIEALRDVAKSLVPEAQNLAREIAKKVESLVESIEEARAMSQVITDHFGREIVGAKMPIYAPNSTTLSPAWPRSIGPLLGVLTYYADDFWVPKAKAAQHGMPLWRFRQLVKECGLDK